MVQHLVVNPELYALAFITDDNMRFDLIRNCIKNIVPNSKKKEIYSNKQDSLLVSNEYYEITIDTVLNFLKNNNREQNVFWVNRNGIFVPCGYYQVAVAGLKEGNVKLSEQEIKLVVEDYRQNISDSLHIQALLPYDYLSHTYSIHLQGNYYEELLLNFNQFVLRNGLGPFEQMTVTTQYGKLTQQQYPILSKKR